MRRAARAALEVLTQHWPESKRAIIFCGGGNNGGDGLVLAGLLLQQGYQVEVQCLSDPAKLGNEAAEARDFALECGVSTDLFNDSLICCDDSVIVDAMLGTGLRTDKMMDQRYLAAIDHINSSECPVLSLDIPSGLCADTGSVNEIAVVADITLTFIALKQGLFTGVGTDHCGTVLVDDLKVPDQALEMVPCSAHRLVPGQSVASLPKRRRNCHKGDCGHLLVIGGNTGMAGAVLMAAAAAARSGAGLVSIATHPEHAGTLFSYRPELMISAVRSGPEISGLMEKARAVLVGPGLGRDSWAEQMLQQALISNLPLVLDADALQLLSQDPFDKLYLDHSGAWRVITPHPGEAAVLLGSDTAAVQKNRFRSAAELCEKWRAIAVLKGSGTLVASSDSIPGLCDCGNPGMASGGMGDVLAGILAGLLVQNPAMQTNTTELVRLGVWIHSAAADKAAQQLGERSLLAGDLFPYIAELLESVTAGSR